MTAIEIILCLVLIIVAIVLIITVLLQQGQRQGLGAIGGGAETFFGKNKAKSYEGKLSQLTKILAAAFIILAILATIVFALPEKADEVDYIDTEVANEVESTEEETEEVTEENTTEETTTEETTTEETTEETTTEETTTEETTTEEESTEETTEE